MRLRDDQLFSTIVDGKTVLLDTRTSRYLSVNATGTVLLEALSHDVTAEDLVTLLCAKFGIDSGQARIDTGAFLHQMRAQFLLVE